MKKGAEFGNLFKTWMHKTQLPLRVFAETLDLDPFSLMAQMQLGKDYIRIDHLDKFREKTGFSLDDLSQGQITPQLLRMRMLGETKTLPDRYSHSKGSRIRSSANIIDYLRFTMGWDWVRDRLNNFHLHEGLFEYPDEEINFLFFMDLFDDLEKQGVNDNTLKFMAHHSVVKNEDSALGRLFSSAQDIYQLYSYLDRNISAFDVNFHYQVQIESEKITLITTPKSQLMDELKLAMPGNRKICKYKQQVFGSLPLYIGESPLHVHEKSCLYEGDKSCEYYVRPLSIALKQHTLRLV